MILVGKQLKIKMRVFLEFIPIFCFSTIFFFVYYIKNRRRRFINYLTEFKERGIISNKTYNYYKNLHHSILGYFNIHTLPNRKELIPDVEDRGYDSFIESSNKRGKIYLYAIGTSILVLFLLVIFKEI